LKRIGLLLLLMVAFAAIPAAADSTVTVTFKGVGGASQGGVYVAPYYLSINGAPSIAAVCDDFSHGVSSSTPPWTATIETFANLTGARFFGTVGFQGYAEAAYLVTLLALNPSQAGNINFAIWAIFTQSVIGANGWTTGAQNFLTMALQWFTANCSTATNTCKNIDLSQFRIITPTDSSLTSPQEYITMVPESATIALVGVGLLFLGWFRRRSLHHRTSGISG
jgi:hypothetical protein